MPIAELIKKLQEIQEGNPDAKVDVVGYYTIMAGDIPISLIRD